MLTASKKILFMNKYILPLISIFFLINSQCAYSQDSAHQKNSDQEDTIEEHHVKHFKKHAISFMISHTNINTGIKDNKDKNAWLALASFGLNYNFNFNEKWALGLHTHMIIEDFAVKESGSHNENLSTFSEEGGSAIIERGTPISLALIGSYKVHKHIALLAGAGMEFSSHKDFKVIKFGVEFPFHIPNNWEIYGALLYDINIDAYQSLTVGMGIAKLF